MATPEDPATHSFTPFPKLAVGLRLRIWQLTFPVSRVLEIPVTFSNWRSLRKYPLACNPVALFVNRESRSEALQLYRPLMRDSYNPYNLTLIKATYFDPNIDIVRIRETGDSPFWERFPLTVFVSRGGVLDYIKHFTFYNVLWDQYSVLQFEGDKDENACFLSFKALENLNLVFDPRYPVEHSWVAEACKATVERYLAKYKMANPEYKIPKITTFFPPLKGEGELW